jgi:hypothetical protein
MSFDNGSGSGGGNGSVWFEVRHGSDSKPQSLEATGLSLPPATATKRSATRKNGGARAASAKRAAASERPDAGQIKLDNDGKCACVSIHDKTNLDDLGADDHKGMFRVRLRIRKQTMEELIANENDPKRRAELRRYWAALPKIAQTLHKYTGEVPIGRNEVWEDTDGDVFLVIDVPAVHRKPRKGQRWPFMPWELYWQW